MPSDAAWWAPPQWSRQPPASARATAVAMCAGVQERGTCNGQTSVGAHDRAHETWPSPRESRARDVGSWWFRITGAESALRLPPQWRYVFVPARATAVAQWARGMCYVVLLAGDQSVGFQPDFCVSMRSFWCVVQCQKRVASRPCYHELCDAHFGFI